MVREEVANDKLSIWSKHFLAFEVSGGRYKQTIEDLKSRCIVRWVSAIHFLMHTSREDNKICIMNDGKGIPVEMHKEHDMFVPTLIFGHLLTSSNYDDSQKKVRFFLDLHLLGFILCLLIQQV